jgi:hypothetical protein
LYGANLSVDITDISVDNTDISVDITDIIIAPAGLGGGELLH